MFKHDESVAGEKRRVIEDVTHQGIGGKEITLEFGLSVDEVFHLCVCEGNWACKNFLDRRKDITGAYKGKLYYGKVEGLGYIVTEEELMDL